MECPSWEEWDAAHLACGRLVAREGGEVVGWAVLSPLSQRSPAEPASKERLPRLKTTDSMDVVANCHPDGWDKEGGAPVAGLGAVIVAKASSSDSRCPAVNASAKTAGSSAARTLVRAASASRRAGPASS
jgi:hypothetical protein